MQSDLRGKVCKCRQGKLGVVYTVRGPIIGDKPGTFTAIGIAFDGSNWQSTDPTIVSDSVEAYITRYQRTDND